MTTLFIILGVAIVVGLALLGIMSRYRVAKPNEALIISGKKGQGGVPQRVVTGGAFVWPVIQTYSVIDLSARRVPVTVRSAPSKQGIRLNVDGVAVVRVGSENPDNIRAVATRYAATQDQIATDTIEVLSGALRAIVGRMTVEEILQDRLKFQQEVSEEALRSLPSGLVLDTLNVKEIVDDAGPNAEPGAYLLARERPEKARAEQEAALAEATAKRISEVAKIDSDQEILDRQKLFDLRKSENIAETDAAAEKARIAGPLAKAQNEQELLMEKQKVAMRQAELTDKELDVQIRKPADAQRYQTEVAAEAEKAAAILKAEAEARENELLGQGEKANRIALAEAIIAEGEAKGKATVAVGLAEAEAMRSKADAYRRYNQAAVAEMAIKALPTIAEKLAEPLGNISNLTIISTEGASALPKSVLENFTQLNTMMQSATGIDLSELLKNFTGSNTDNEPVEGEVISAVSPETNASELPVNEAATENTVADEK